MTRHINSCLICPFRNGGVDVDRKMLCCGIGAFPTTGARVMTNAEVETARKGLRPPLWCPLRDRDIIVSLANRSSDD